MEIKIKQLILKNFKGIKELDVKFGEITDIRGANATGKTSIFDAFNWLIFGKDSKDRKDFNIKTLDGNGNELHGLEHSVTGVLEIDGKAIKLQRLYKEKWSKTKGQATKELKGHTTEYQINEVPVSMKEYQFKINEIFDEDKFKLITNPLYFTNMNWKEQRKILLEIIGDVDESNVINYNKELKPLEGLIDDGIDNFNKATTARIKKLKESVKSLPYRIDECNNSIVDEDFDALEIEKSHLSNEICRIDAIISDKSKANNEKLKLQDKLFELKSEHQSKFNTAKNSLVNPKDEILANIANIESKVRIAEYANEGIIDNKISLNEKKSRYEKSIEDTDNQLIELRKRFKEIKAQELEIDENNFKCPTCNRVLDQADIDSERIELIKNFEERKINSINHVREKGQAGKKEIDKLKNAIRDIDNQIDSLDKLIEENLNEISCFNSEINKLNEKLKSKKDDSDLVVGYVGMKEALKSIEELEVKINAFSESDNSHLIAEKSDLQEKLDNINRLLGKRDNNETLRARIKELEADEKELSVSIAKQEGLQYLGEQFIRTKVELLEAGINNKFKGDVEFKLFNNQVNGGLSETCEALIDGVPFSNANTASQINAGLNILNTLCEHFNAYAPVFVDNAESVNSVVATKSQLIKLIVSLDKKLKVEVK